MFYLGYNRRAVTDVTSQEMEQERLAKEAEERASAEREKQIKEQFGDATPQWEKDKAELSNLAKQDKKQGTAKGPTKGPAKDAPAKPLEQVNQDKKKSQA